MAQQKKFGERLDPGFVNPRQVPTNPTSKQSLAPIQIDRYFRNGKHPSAAAQNDISSACNAGALYRTKSYFEAMGLCLGTTASFGAGDRARWRFSFRSGPYCHAMGVILVMMPQSTSTSSNSYARLDIATNAAGTPAVISEEFVYGAAPDPNDGYGQWKQIIKIVDGLSPSTDYYATWVDVDYGRVFAVSCFELASLTENAGGYVSTNSTIVTPITDEFRENCVDMSNALYQESAGKVLVWSVDDGTAPQTRTSATSINVIDQTSTAISAATPGFTLDMRNKARLSQTTGVPIVLRAYGKNTVAPGGTVYLKNAAGATIMSVTGFGTTAGWVSATGVIPANDAKVDLHFAGDGANTFSLYAVSCFQYL